MATHYLYWLRDKNCKNIFRDGYVGVTSNPTRRRAQHRYDCKRYDRFWSFDEMIIILEANLEECLRMENMFRPHEMIGWNTKPGGEPEHWAEKHL